MSNIRYIKRNELDADKWNGCIDAAPNGLIYAYTFYLDAMCDHWDALVLNDYEAVMPLPWRKKWGITYVYTPRFIQQLGLFSKLTTQNLTSLFFNKAEIYFRFGDYFINYDNAEYVYKRTNFILPLNKPYKLLYEAFAKDLKNNLKKAAQYHLQYNQTEDFKKAITVYQQLYKDKIGNLTADDFKRFTTLCSRLLTKQMLCIREVTDTEGRLLAIALFTKDNKRLYLLANSTTGDGKKMKATHFLLDRLIHEFSNTQLILDFEGSDLPGVKYFYANFGTINQPYFFHHWNKLHWLLRLLK